jgi:purine-binding chemotaxis protein CheW
MSAKNKLDASLDGLFSKSTPHADPEPETPPEMGAEKVIDEVTTQEPASAGMPAPAKKQADGSAASGPERQLVVFSMANEFYGVDITIVESIIRAEKMTVVPRAPQFINGVINMRGEVLPVVDLCTRFGLSGNKETNDSRIIVLEVNNLRVGMGVDAVTEVLRVPETLIEPPSPLVTTIDSAFISGIAKVPDRLVILLDLEKVLMTEEKTDLAALSVAA